MSLFRSEEHLNRWLGARDLTRGAVVSLETIWTLAKAWYVDPRDKRWRPRTRNESQDVINSAGLTGEFWELPA